MIPIVFINCKDVPFVDLIIKGEKQLETRTRNTLGGLVGRRVLLAETGHGKPVVKCYATIMDVVKVDSRSWWKNGQFRHMAKIPLHSKYDWATGTKCKWVYGLTDVVRVGPFIPKEGKRHGRVWMEYETDD